MAKSTKTDHSPRRSLAPSKGELWLEMKIDDRSFAGASETEVQDRIVELVAAKKLGKYSGRSSGGGAMDVTFTVKNRAEDAPRLRKLVKQHFPKLKFSVSDDYEGKFSKPQRDPSIHEQLEGLATLAGTLAGAIAALAAQLAKQSAPPKRRKPSV